jgi:hypothetical protein
MVVKLHKSLSAVTGPVNQMVPPMKVAGTATLNQGVSSEAEAQETTGGGIGGSLNDQGGYNGTAEGEGAGGAVGDGGGNAEGGGGDTIGDREDLLRHEFEEKQVFSASPPNQSLRN